MLRKSSELKRMETVLLKEVIEKGLSYSLPRADFSTMNG
jgi:hypothetical protein